MDSFLICGLGSLGQHCAMHLERFSSDEMEVRIVVRSFRERLNQLLASHLENWVALDPTELPAPAFALAALRDGTIGVFEAGGHSLRVVERVIAEDDPFRGVPVARLHRDNLRILGLQRAGIDPEARRFSPAAIFFQWEPGAVLETGDKVALIETTRANESVSETRGLVDWEHFGSRLRSLSKEGIAATFGQFQRWVEADRNRMLAGLGCFTLKTAVGMAEIG